MYHTVPGVAIKVGEKEDEEMVIIIPLDMRTCARCHKHYEWRKSTSWTLKMTYCTAMCEQAALGFTIEGIIKLDITRIQLARLQANVTQVASAVRVEA